MALIGGMERGFPSSHLDIQEISRSGGLPFSAKPKGIPQAW